MAVRQTMIDMVLATDMTKHFEHLNKFHIFMADVQKEVNTIISFSLSNPQPPLPFTLLWSLESRVYIS